jgi:hypothetical protein
MYYIHHFAHHETLRRACDWLGRLGYRPSGPVPGHATSPWLTLNVPTAQLVEVELLVNAAENSDPLGWPSFWDEARHAYSAPGLASAADEAQTDGARAAIGWHPIDESDRSNRAEFERLREAMGH